MTRKAPGIKPPEPVTRPQAHDAAASLYTDRAGPARIGVLSEGKDNFGAITAEAHKTVALAALTHEAGDGDDD